MTVPRSRPYGGRWGRVQAAWRHMVPFREIRVWIAGYPWIMGHGCETGSLEPSTGDTVGLVVRGAVVSLSIEAQPMPILAQYA